MLRLNCVFSDLSLEILTALYSITFNATGTLPRILLSEEFVFVHYLYLLLYVTLPILIPHRTIIHKTSQLFQIKKAV